MCDADSLVRILTTIGPFAGAVLVAGFILLVLRGLSS